jgi:hypothetical protein
MAFADRYLNRLSEAVDTLEAQHPTPECRIAAHATKYYPSLTVLSLACEAEPESALLDLLVVVTLERMVWEGAWSQEVFGEQAPILTTAQRDVEADIWNVAASVLSPAQIQEMHDLIDQWRREHPERRYVSSTRFDDFAAMRVGRPESQLHHGFLAPVSEAARTVEQARLLGERTLFLATRMPLILHWQTELLMNEMAGKPEVQALLSHSGDISVAAQRFADVTQDLPNRLAEQRAAFMHDIESQQNTARQTLDEVRAGLDDAAKLVTQIEKVAGQASPMIQSAQALVHNVDESLTSADRLAARLEAWQASAAPTSQPARAFDIREYTEAAAQMSDALKQLNQALASTEGMLDSPTRAGLVEHIDDIITQRVSQAGVEARGSINKLFWLGALLVVLACASVVLAGWFSLKVLRPHSAEAPAQRGTSFS